MPHTYATKSPRHRNGAPMGRASDHLDDPHLFTGALMLRKVRLDAQGYDEMGVYWGTREPGEAIYWYASDDGAIDATLDACDRERARKVIRWRYPNARFHR